MPFRNQLHVDRLLSNISVKYSNAEYIADKIFPILAVQNETDLYRVWVRDFKNPTDYRRDGAESREYQFNVTTNAYRLRQHALKALVTDTQARNYDIADLKADTVEFLTDAVLRRREIEVIDNFVTSTSWSLNVSIAAASAWTTNTSLPIPIVDTAGTTILQNSGQIANFGVIGRTGWVNLKNHTTVADRVKYTSVEIGEAIVAKLLGLGELLISKAVQDTGVEGVADSISSIWPDSMFVGYKPASPGPLKPSCGYLFQYNKPPVKRWREEKRDGEMIEVNMEYSPEIVASLCGYLIIDIV